MKNLNTWIHNYKSLSCEQQYEVAKALKESLEKVNIILWKKMKI